jgi:hypothetical protein
LEGVSLFRPDTVEIAADYLNNYFSVEKDTAAQLKDAHFQKGRHEYLPIPINQINYSKGLYKQNNGW